MSLRVQQSIRLLTFAQDVAVDGFESCTDQGGFDEFLGPQTVTSDFLSCNHDKL